VAVAALFVLARLLLRRAGQSGMTSVWMVCGAALVSVVLVYALFQRVAGQEQAAERRALEARAAELTARSLAPGSALSCLDAVASVVVENACERPLFSSPEAVAAAVEYIDARFSLLAASAALAADTLHPKGDIDALGVIGCGLINGEVIRFIASLRPGIGRILLFDIDGARAAKYRQTLSTVVPDVPVEVCASPEDVMAKASVISFATTAVQPTIAAISGCRSGATVLHVSLRDLMAEAILQADNIVDDVDHVMRAQTSVHLAQQKVGNHDFVRCTLADILLGTQPARRDTTSVAVFSPFGLGVLDLAVAKLAVRHARAKDSGVRIDGFFAGT